VSHGTLTLSKGGLTVGHTLVVLAGFLAGMVIPYLAGLMAGRGLAAKF